MAQAFDRKVFIAKVSFSDIGFLDTFILQFNAGADPHSPPALLFAQHDAETDRRPEPEMWRRLVDAYGARTADYVLMVIRIFFFANLLGNILDAVLVLCRGQGVAMAWPGRAGVSKPSSSCSPSGSCCPRNG